MKIGVVKEIKPDEYRVALTPAGARELVARGHEVVVERGRGHGIAFTDAEYVAAGARVDAGRPGLGASPSWCSRSRSRSRRSTRASARGQLLFTYLHLAPAPELTQALIDSGATCIAYETVETDDHRLPLLAPMSEVAGPARAADGRARARAAAAADAACCSAASPGVAPAKVVVLGGGIVGYNAALIARRHAGRRVGARPLDRPHARARPDARRPRHDRRCRRRTRSSRRSQDADLVIGAVLVPGARAPKLVTREMLGLMKPRRGARRRRDRPGRLLRDVARDDALRPDVRGRRGRALLRREHARRRADHLDPGAHERDAPVPRARGRRGSERAIAAARALARGVNVLPARSPRSPSPRRSATRTCRLPSLSAMRRKVIK